MAADLDQLHLRAERVRDGRALSDLIGADVRLEKRGREMVGLCPFHNDSKLGSFSINDDKQIFKCFTCGAGGDHFVYLRERKGLTFMQALALLEADAGIDFSDARRDPKWERLREKRQREQQDDAERRRRRAEGLWLSGTPMQGTPAEAYLRGRGIDFARLGRFPGAIRYRHDCWCSEAKRPMPAMVTRMTFLDGRFAATHRTFLHYGPTGWTKAPLEKAKSVLGDFKAAHIALVKGDSGRVPLHAVADGTTVAISEGIEDGLTVAMADPSLRLVAATSLDNIGNVALPEQVSDVVMVGQRDREWREFMAADAARRGAHVEAAKHLNAADDIDRAFQRQIAKHQATGRQVLCMWPDAGFKDFNDQLRGVRMEAA